jgi:hypothetical protein
MYHEEPNVAMLVGEEDGEDGQDFVLKCVPIAMLSSPTQSLDPDMLTRIGVVVWASGSGFRQRFPGGGERSLEC